MFKSLPFFIFLIIVLVVVQIWAAYLSITAFLSGDWVQGALFFIFVPLLGVFLTLYYARIRKNKKP